MKPGKSPCNRESPSPRTEVPPDPRVRCGTRVGRLVLKFDETERKCTCASTHTPQVLRPVFHRNLTNLWEGAVVERVNPEQLESMRNFRHRFKGSIARGILGYVQECGSLPSLSRTTD